MVLKVFINNLQICVLEYVYVLHVNAILFYAKILTLMEFGNLVHSRTNLPQI